VTTSGEGHDTLTMQGVEHNRHEELTLLELVLLLHGELRRRLELIRVTPLQAGVLLFLRHHAEAKVTDAAAALGIRPPTLSEVVKDLVRKGWVTKHRSGTDTRVVHLRLSRRGDTLALQVEQRVGQVEATLTEQDGCALGMIPQGSRA
jgi:DNA-binding MarR family transcriptional regulator